MSSVDASIVIPTYNERANILELVRLIHTVLEPMPIEVIVVDDQSPDGTAAVANEYAKEHPWLSVIQRKGERSLSGSVIDGLRQATGRVLCVLDADLSHDPALLPQMITAVRQGTEFVIGSRRVSGGGAENWPWYRRGLSSLGNGLAQCLLRLSIADTMSGYFAMDRCFYEKVRDRVHPMGYKILLEFCVHGRPRSIQELPYTFRNRRQGYSKLTFTVAFAYLMMLAHLSADAWLSFPKKQ